MLVAGKTSQKLNSAKPRVMVAYCALSGCTAAQSQLLILLVSGSQVVDVKA